jgi:RimJ/RimL family protein N-acetyltransferase
MARAAAAKKAATPVRRDGRQHESVKLRDGARLLLRPLEIADLSQAQEFFDQLSEETRYMRMMRAVPRLTPELVLQFVTPRSPRSLILVATVPEGEAQRIVGGARVEPTEDPKLGELAALVVDAWQGRGVGTALLRSLAQRSRQLGYDEIEGHLLAVNAKLLHILRRFRCRFESEGPGTGLIRVSLRIRRPRTKAAAEEPSTPREQTSAPP